MSIRDAGNHLALTLAATAIQALGRANLLTDGERKRCADRMKSFAAQAEGIVGPEELPPKLAQDVHAIALELLKGLQSQG